jgi:DNA polymerase-1
MRDVELEEIKEYAVEDADVTLQLIFTLELDKQEPRNF